MDVVSSVSAVVGLVFNFATAIKTCNDIRGRYKDADRTVGSIRDELQTLQGALQELANLMMHDASSLTSRWDTNKTLPKTFERALRGFRRTVKGLQDDMEPLQTNAQLGKMDKVKLLWNDDAMKEHLGQLRAQSSALQLLLLVLQTGSLSDVKNNLNNVEAALIQLSISSNGEGDGDGNGDSDVWDNNLPAYHNDVLRPSHILDVEEDLLDLDWSVVKQFSPPPLPSTQNIAGSSNSPSQDAVKDNISSAESRVPTPSISPFTYQPLRVTAANVTFSLHESSMDQTERSKPSAGRHESLKNPDSSTSTLRKLEQSPNHSTSNSTPTYDPRTSVPLLIRAVYRGDVDDVKSLMSAGNDVEVRHPSNDRTATMVAALLGDSEILRILLDSGASVATKDRFRRTALHYAASEGWVDCVNMLLSLGTQCVRDCEDEPPLHHAIRYGQEGVVKVLLPLCANPLNHLNQFGENILHQATRHQHVDVVRLILEVIRKTEHRQGCAHEVDHSLSCECPITYPGIDAETYVGENALQIAMKGRNFVLSSLLLPLFPSGVHYPFMTPPRCRPVDASTETISWTRPLHLATVADMNLLQQLLTAGANVNLLDGFGRSPLTCAIECGGKEAFKILLAHGADFMAPVRSLKTPLEESTLAFSPTILDDLVALRPDLDLSSSFAARAVLKQAQIGSRWDTVRKLVERCLRQDQVGTILDEEETLFQALWFEDTSPEVVEFLLRSGANVQLESSYSFALCRDLSFVRMPIHFTAGYGRLDMASTLLKNGASIWSKDSNGWLPLHKAIRFADVATVLYFLERMLLQTSRKECTALSSEIERALKIACKRGSLDILELILEQIENSRLGSIELNKVALRTAVQYGRRNLAEYLLGYCSFSTTTLNAVQKAKFASLPQDSDERSRNHLQDYERCKVLVANAIDRDRKGLTNKTKRRV